MVGRGCCWFWPHKQLVARVGLSQRSVLSENYDSSSCLCEFSALGPSHGDLVAKRHSNPITTWVADQRKGAAFFLLQVLGPVSRDTSSRLPAHCSLP